MNYNVRARRAGDYWELHIDGEGVTQSTSLALAPTMVRDWLASEYERDFTGAEVTIIPELGGYEAEVADARDAVLQAAIAQRIAAIRQREVARTLRESGLNVADTSTVLGVSKGRVSQLVNS